MSQKNRAVIAVILGDVVFGFSFLFSKIALQITIPSVLIAVRFTVAFFLLNILVLIGRNVKNSEGKALLEFKLKGKPIKYVLALAVFQPVIYFAAENYGIIYTSSAFAGTIIAIIPIAGIVFDVLLLKSHVSGKQIICAFCSVIGVVLTSAGGELNVSAKGLFLLLVAVIAGAMFFVLSKKAAPFFSAVERTYVMFAVGSIVYVVLALIQIRGNVAVLVTDVFSQRMFWLSIMYLAAASSVAAFVLLNYGSNYISVTRASMFANLTTVISIAAGVIVLHESFTAAQFIGAVIILVSVYFSGIQQEK